MKLKKHYYTAYLKTWKWDPKTNNIDMESKEFSKEFTHKELKNQLFEDKLAILGYTLVTALIGCLGFLGNWVSGLIFVCCGAFLGFLIGLLNYLLIHYFGEFRYDLGEEDGWMEDAKLKYIFLEEITQNQENKKLQEELAAKWRKNHPLEEKIRLALTGNPNYIAELLKYCELVKPNKNMKKHIENIQLKNDLNNEINNKIKVKSFKKKN